MLRRIGYINHKVWRRIFIYTRVIRRSFGFSFLMDFGVCSKARNVSNNLSNFEWICSSAILFGMRSRSIGNQAYNSIFYWYVTKITRNAAFNPPIGLTVHCIRLSLWYVKINLLNTFDSYLKFQLRSLMWTAIALIWRQVLKMFSQQPNFWQLLL